MRISRSSHRSFFVKKIFLEILQNSQENNCARVSFLLKLQASGTDVFQRILQNFLEHLFYRTSPGDCFYISSYFTLEVMEMLPKIIISWFTKWTIKVILWYPTLSHSENQAEYKKPSIWCSYCVAIVCLS